MILKREALPVRLHVHGVHTDYVTVSEDSQPMHPGVSQNVGCTRLLFPSSLPPLRSALITPVCLCCSTIAPTNWGGVGCWMTWITSTCVEGGWQPECAHTLARCHTVPFSLWSSHFLTSSHIHTHIQSCAHADPLWWLWQPFVRSKRFLSKQNQSPPPSSAAESSGARSLPASLFKSGLKRQADLHSTFTFEKNWGKLGELWLRKC